MKRVEMLEVIPFFYAKLQTDSRVMNIFNEYAI